MSTSFLQPCTRISTRFYCDNCLARISEVTWTQCSQCKLFDLCKRCSQKLYNQLDNKTRTKHEEIHKTEKIDVSFDEKYMVTVCVGKAEEYWSKRSPEKRRQEFELIVNDGAIKNDSQLAIVLDELKDREQSQIGKSEVEPSLSGDIFKCYSMISKYYMPTIKTTKHVLSLDGGGKSINIMYSARVSFLLFISYRCTWLFIY